MSEHPSRDELAALRGGGLSPAREREVLLHLLSPCGECLAAAPPPLGVLLGSEPARRPSTAAEEDAYDAAVIRVINTVSKHERRLRREQAQARKIVKALKESGPQAADSIDPRVGPMARMIAFLDWSWQLRHEDPEQMVQFALYAALVSRDLDVRRYGLEQVFDFQARAHAELGNAYRVQDRLHEAVETLGRARELFERGSRDKLLEVRLLELEATLAADYRQFGRASEKLLQVLKFYSRYNDFHLVGRTLIKIGLYSGYAGDLRKAIRRLKQGLALVDVKRDPVLAYAARHNQVTFLVDAENFREAEKQLFLLRPLCQNSGGRINLLRLRWEEGRIDAGLQRYSRAATLFRELRTEFEEVHRPYDAAIVSLHFTAALLAQGKSGEASSVALKTVETFIRLGIQREALQAVILLRCFQDANRNRRDGGGSRALPAAS